MAAGLKDRGVDLRDVEIVNPAAAIPQESEPWRRASPKRLGGAGKGASAGQREDAAQASGWPLRGSSVQCSPHRSLRRPLLGGLGLDDEGTGNSRDGGNEYQLLANE